MTKHLYNNAWEKGKWKITKWFIDKYVDKNTKVLDMYAGLGHITRMYASKAKKVFVIERDSTTFSELKKQCKEFTNIKYYLGDNLTILNNLNNHPELKKVNVVDLDPWSNANKQIVKVLEEFNDIYLLITTGEPYAITRFKSSITRYGGTPIDDWKGFSDILFRRFINREAETLNKTVELINHYDSPRVCRLVIKVK